MTNQTIHLQRSEVPSDLSTASTLRRSLGCLMFLVASSAGCAADEPAVLGAEHFAGDAADPSAEVHTGTIATPGGQLDIGYELIDGHAVVEGDIVIPPGDFVDRNIAHAGSILRSQTWPGGVIPYEIDAGLPDPGRVTSAIAHWHSQTFIRLVPRTNQADYVRFVNSTGCSSYVGRVGGAQNVWLASACSVGNAIHEIGHAAGLWHEQSRQDRDNSVIIHTQNIQSGYEHNFNKYGSGMDLANYDVGSIMHYGSYAFSSNGQPTITTRSGGTIAGQRNGLSAIDKLGINMLYSVSASGDRMAPAQMLLPEQSVRSNDGRYQLKYQGDGNLVVYRTADGRALWASNTHGSAAGACIMQPDGNLVIYRPDGTPIWASGTSGRPGGTLVVQNDGNVVIYVSGGVPIWHTNTWQPG